MATPKSATAPVKHESLAGALAAFQREIPVIEKSAAVSTGKYGYQYAPLEEIVQVVMPRLASHGLSWTSMPTVGEGGAMTLDSVLMHESGEKIRAVMPLPPAGTAPQQLGSALTYARRYALCALTGVAPGGEDDDAQNAQNAPVKAPAKTQVQKPKPAKQAQQLLTVQAWESFAPRIEAATTKADLLAIHTEARQLGVIGCTTPDGQTLAEYLKTVAATRFPEAVAA